MQAGAVACKFKTLKSINQLCGQVHAVYIPKTIVRTKIAGAFRIKEDSVLWMMRKIIQD